MRGIRDSICFHFQKMIAYGEILGFTKMGFGSRLLDKFYEGLPSLDRGLSSH